MKLPSKRWRGSFMKNWGFARASRERFYAINILIRNVPAILLIFYRLADFDGEPRNLEFAQIRWESAERLRTTIFWKATPNSSAIIRQMGESVLRKFEFDVALGVQAHRQITIDQIQAGLVQGVFHADVVQGRPFHPITEGLDDVVVLERD